MKRRTSTAPIRVYRYGLPIGPVSAEHYKLVDEQILRAHRYRNELVAIERGRRAAAREVLGEHEDVAPIEEKIKTVDEERELLRKSLRMARQQTRRRVRDPEIASRVKTLGAELKTLRAQRKEALSVVRDDAGIKSQLEAIEERVKIWSKAARASCGVYWGSYLLAEAAAQQARGEKMDPKFRPARPYSDRVGTDGVIAVQIQGGMSLEELTAGTDTRVRLDVANTWPGKGRSPTPRPMVHLRVGSDGRAPIWASFPIVLHRPIPADARITWVRVKRRRIGTNFRWEALFTVEAESLRPIQRLPSVTAAIDIGWRRVEDGLRVATIRSDASDDVEQIIMPWKFVERLRHADSLRAIRDRNFEELRSKLIAALAACHPPEWLSNATATLSQWRNGSRLIRIGYRWREQRFMRDQDAFCLLDEWRRQDHHLHQWESAQRDSTLGARKDFYRVEAKRIAGKHPRVVLAKLDLRNVARHAKVEDPEDSLAAREYRFVAAVGEFRMAISQAVTSGGGTVEVRDVQATACYSCGALCSWNAEAQEWHTCEHCGRLWQTDDNQCRKLLAAVASGEAA